ncbi:unnamed protein product, partial [marine sediment metagenome]
SEKQVYEIEIEENEIKPVKKVKKKARAKKANKSNGISNPRYFENARTPKKARKALPLKTLSLYRPQF